MVYKLRTIFKRTRTRPTVVCAALEDRTFSAHIKNQVDHARLETAYICSIAQPAKLELECFCCSIEGFPPSSDGWRRQAEDRDVLHCSSTSAGRGDDVGTVWTHSRWRVRAGAGAGGMIYWVQAIGTNSLIRTNSWLCFRATSVTAVRRIDFLIWYTILRSVHSWSRRPLPLQRFQFSKSLARVLYQFLRIRVPSTCSFVDDVPASILSMACS